MGAVISSDQVYRYALWREIEAQGNEGTVLFVMLNPSTADASVDDPTIRRCMGFARDWGYGRLAVGNLYAMRATDPVQLAQFKGDPIGPENDEWLRKLVADADQTIVAWGNGWSNQSAKRAAAVLDLLTYGGSLSVECLGQTKTLNPRHPLYIAADTRPQVFVRRSSG